jgi:hypothetical protein
MDRRLDARLNLLQLLTADRSRWRDDETKGECDSNA